ncbi:hypothetical protein B566_EDAN017143 [Ephemera danica]|nr:hypothetical protein B566_EDAN017143 [Ephemera danica]
MARRVSGDWLVGGLADMEHRLLRAEEGWRRLQQRSACSAKTASNKRLELLMRHVETAEQRHYAADEEAGRRHSLSSSESSLDTLLQDNIYSQLLEPSTLSPLTVPAACGSREEVRRRLRELALTSESGNASVLEVIEPVTSEEEVECVTGDYQSVRGSPAFHETHQPPDLLLGALGDTTAEDVPLQQLKKRTFLQKLSLKASWPAKRKPKPGKVMTPDDFKETYLWHSPSCTGSSSEQEAGSSSSSDGKSSVTVEASPPPPQELTLPAVSVTVSSVVTESEPPPPPAPVETQVPPPVQTLPASTTATDEVSKNWRIDPPLD